VIGGAKTSKGALFFEPTGVAKAAEEAARIVVNVASFVKLNIVYKGGVEEQEMRRRT
jgi:hypothetical protein